MKFTPPSDKQPPSTFNSRAKEKHPSHIIYYGHLEKKMVTVAERIDVPEKIWHLILQGYTHIEINMYC